MWRAKPSDLCGQPLVTTGGGALPLPTFAQPAMLRSASTAAVASTIFFISAPYTDSSMRQDKEDPMPALVQKRHTPQTIGAAKLGVQGARIEVPVDGGNMTIFASIAA